MKARIVALNGVIGLLPTSDSPADCRRVQAGVKYVRRDLTAPPTPGKVSKVKAIQKRDDFKTVASAASTAPE